MLLLHQAYLLLTNTCFTKKRDKLLLRGISLLTPRRTIRNHRETVTIERWFFVREGRFVGEYVDKVHPANKLNSLKAAVDVVSFPERAFVDGKSRCNYDFCIETLALLELKNYDRWLRGLSESQARTLRQSKKLGVEVRLRRWDAKDTDAIYSLYHETSSRQGMRFSPYYQYSRNEIRSMWSRSDSRLAFVAYLDGKLLGIMGVRVGELGGIVETMLRTYRDRIPGLNNALIACAVRELCARGIEYLIYGHMGYLSGLDAFKRHNGFKPFRDRRYFIPVTQRGAWAINMGICLEPWQLVPTRIWSVVCPIGRVLSHVVDFLPTPDVDTDVLKD